MPLDSSSFKSEELPFLLTSNDVVTDVGYAFYSLTDYTKAEIVSRTFCEVLCDMLRMAGNSNDCHGITGGIIFTRGLQAVEVKIHSFKGICSGERLYIFEEKPGSRLDDKFIFMEQMFNENIVGIAVYSVPDLILLKANQRYLDFLEAPNNLANHSIGRPISEIFADWKGSRFEAIWKRVLATKTVFYNKEYRHDKFGKGITYLDSTISPVFENGKMKYIVENFTDVTDRVHNRRQLERQARLIEQKHRELEAVIENMSDALFIYDRNGNLIISNASARKYTGHISSGRNDFDKVEFRDMNGRLIPRDELPLMLALKGLKTRDKRMAVNYDVDKTIIAEVNATQVYDSDGNIDLVILCCRNVTNIVKDEKVIQQQKEHLEAIIESMSEGLFTVDKDLNITAYNQGGMSFLNTNEKTTNLDKLKTITCDMNGRTLNDGELPGARVLSGEKVRFERLLVKNGDSVRYYSLSGSPVLDKDGQISMAVLCTRDITNQINQERLAEENQRRLIQAEQEKNVALKRAIEVKDEFLSLISHEFKTPLAVINSAVQAMEVICGDEMPPKALSFLSIIKQNSFRQIRLVNNLLDITRINAGRIKMFRKNTDIAYLTQNITESVLLYSQQKDIALEFTSTFPSKIIGIDEEKYERIMLNLLSNAIKFSPKGSTIKVRLSCKKGFIAVDVSDSGVGIPKDKLNVIFEKFGQVDNSLTRQAEGTGIGLSLVKLFVESMGGKITVRSKVGQGSTFTVLLPDITIIEEKEEKMLQELTDNRLISSTAVEFSDIYLT